MKKTIKKNKDQMINKISPLAPKVFRSMRPMQGVSIYTYCANLYNYNRLDVLLFLFEDELNIAEVFTRSKTRSITLDWNEKNLKKGKIKALLINSGNANTFTGKQGKDALDNLTQFIKKKFHIDLNKIFIASTGVIGEPFPYEKIIGSMSHHTEKNKSNWLNAARAIMTTDTFPKLKEANTLIDGKKVIIKGIAKGSGMIAPNMATMLGFIFTDANITRPVLQALLKEINEDSFNSITVDSDESTNDTVMLISTNYVKHKKSANGLDSSNRTRPPRTGFDSTNQAMRRPHVRFVESHTSSEHRVRSVKNESCCQSDPAPHCSRAP